MKSVRRGNFARQLGNKFSSVGNGCAVVRCDSVTGVTRVFRE